MHEGSHACVAVALGYPFELVTLVPRAGDRGHISLAAPRSAAEHKARAIALLAGREGQLRSGYPTERVNASHDYSLAAESAAAAGLPLADLESEAKHLVATHSSEIETLADALEQSQTLSSAEVAAIIESSSMINSPVKFPHTGLPVALAPDAASVEWSFSSPPRDEIEVCGSIALVKIRGPITHHQTWNFESYDCILDRARCAFGDEQTKAVLLSLSSPGGDVSGMLSTALELIAMSERSGKPLFIFADGQMCSAAMCLGCAGSQIFAAPGAILGSIGVIAEVIDLTAAAEASGQRTYLVASGAAKTDGHPLSAPDDETIARIREGVETEARLFYEFVAERRGLDVETIAGFEAGVFRGTQAVEVGLADQVCTLSECLATIAELIEPQGSERTESTMTIINRTQLPAASAASHASRCTCGIDPSRECLACASRASAADSYIPETTACRPPKKAKVKVKPATAAEGELDKPHDDKMIRGADGETLEEAKAKIESFASNCRP